MDMQYIVLVESDGSWHIVGKKVISESIEKNT